jgi:hypothetical protein
LLINNGILVCIYPFDTHIELKFRGEKVSVRQLDANEWGASNQLPVLTWVVAEDPLCLPNIYTHHILGCVYCRDIYLLNTISFPHINNHSIYLYTNTRFNGSLDIFSGVRSTMLGNKYIFLFIFCHHIVSQKDRMI